MWKRVICRCQTSKSPTLTFDGNEFQVGMSPSGPQKTLICQKRMRWKPEGEAVCRNTASKWPTHGAHGDAERCRGCRRGLHGGGRGLVRWVSGHTAAAPCPVRRRLCKHSQIRKNVKRFFLASQFSELRPSFEESPPYKNNKIQTWN